MLRGRKAARIDVYAPKDAVLELRLVKGDKHNYKHRVDCLRIAILASTSTPAT